MTRDTREATNLSENFLDLLQKLTPREVGIVARILAERFPSVDESMIEAELPRVGETLAEGVVVRKVERREDTRQRPYWLVGMDLSEKTQTKKITHIGDRYKISWKAGPHWKHSVVEPHDLRCELAKPV